MGFFDDDDPFDGIFKEFFGNGNVRRKNYRMNIGEEEERMVDFVEQGNELFVILEMPGFDEGEVFVKVGGNVLEVSAEKRAKEGVKDYLLEKFSSGFSYQRKLPEGVNTKNYSYTLRNGILEIKFSRGKR